MIDVCLPGTGGMMPIPNRYLSCCHITSQGLNFLIDCGEGTQVAMRQAGIKLSRLDVLLLTHFHADHVMGVPGLLLSLYNNAKTSPLCIIGPKGLCDVLSKLLVVCPTLPFPVYLYEWEKDDPNTFELGDFSVSSFPLSHSALCFGYRITYRRKPVFNPQKAAALHVPVKLYKSLHAGEAVQIDTRTITPDMVTDGQRPPIVICYMTDTSPAESLL